jgi:N-ethylmaleimide reductase
MPSFSVFHSTYYPDVRCDPSEGAMSEKSFVPNEIMGDYYEQRATAGLIITEATAFDEEGYSWAMAPKIANDEQVAAWKKIVDRVHAKDSRIFIQLWHMGRQAHSSFHPTHNRIVAPSAIAMPESVKVKTASLEEASPEVPHSMTIEEIESTIRGYVKAAQRSKEAGFDGIELHCANGYLLDTFLQSSTNTRTDKYGGSTENRVRILTEIVEAIIESGAYPANRIGFRISPNGTFGGMGSADNYEMFLFVAKTMSKYGLAYLHIMDGLGFGFHNLCAPVTTFDVKKEFNGPVLCNVALTKEVAEGMLRSGAADMAVFGRLFMSNPDLPERFANNWPLAEPAAYETWWQHTGAKGYTDFPTYEPKEEAK